jgi:hypothetical protein
MSSSTNSIAEVVTPREAAQHLKVAEKTLNNWRCKCRGPKYVKMGGIILYRLSDLNDFINASVVEPSLNVLRRRSSASASTGTRGRRHAEKRTSPKEGA